MVCVPRARSRLENKSPDPPSYAGGGFDPIDDANSVLNDKEAAREYLTRVYKKLLRQFNWFKRTQWGKVSGYAKRVAAGVDADRLVGFRWRGRTSDHTLTSGLDDYPRAHTPHPGELHVDLISWIAFYAKTLASVAREIPGMEADVDDLEAQYKVMVDSLEGMCPVYFNLIALH